MDILFWILVWVLGFVICMLWFYLVGEEVTLRDALCALFGWWLITPVAIGITMAACIVWLFDNANDIVLVDKRKLEAEWRERKERKAREKKAKEANKLSEALESLQKQTEDIEKSKLNNNNIKK